MDSNDHKNNSGGSKGNGNWRGILSLVCWALLLTILINSATAYLGSTGRQSSSVPIENSEFVDMVKSGQVESVEFSNSENILLITPRENYVYTDSEGVNYVKTKDGYLYTNAAGAQQTVSLRLFTVQIQSNDQVVALLDSYGVDYDQPYQAQLNPLVSAFIEFVLPFVLLMLMFSLAMRWISKKGGMGGMGGLGGVGKANAKVYMEKSTGVTFRDVAGQDEAKESLTEIIDFLHNPGKYTEIGAKLPKGALLVGPPGTGKTLLAKAVAGEANVPFFSIAGSDFVEMFVGVGASRVRDLFKEASKVAPCIVFIDEIDTIGKSRDNRMGGNDEREQTLNQLLAEMDGFDPTKGIILLAATNRPEVLDQALLRPGRFDRRIIIDRPNLSGRLATLQVHTRNIKLGEDVNLKKVALATAGCVGADLANLVNEAALRAVRKGRKLVTQEDLLAAFELVIAGTEKKGSVLTEFEKKLVAYHEVGHAMVAYKQKNTEPVQKITIVPHTEGSLGYTLLMPEEDKTNLRTKEELMAKITVSMGGRAAEEVVMHTMTNGASQDIQEATNIARNMVAMFGMSDEFGMMALGSIRNQYLDGGYGLDCAQETAAIMDKEVKVILDQCYKDAVALIQDNLEDMHKVVAYLLEKETITGGEMVAIIEGRDPALVEDAYASTRQSEKKKPLPGDIEPPARNIHIVSEEIKPPVPLGDGEEHAPDGSQPEDGQPAAEEQPDEGQPEPDAAEENAPPTAEDAPRPEDGQLSDEDESKE